ncbi:MAG: L-seryl-tRNA(Sec) selenium transferase [Chloroflexota bacterium]|nr:L-seryl-tRNA(Sec) selenium transferase [Chloroflexota bacterium]
MGRDELRNLPSVTELANVLLGRDIVASREVAIALARDVQQWTRNALLAGDALPVLQELDRQIDRIEQLLNRSRLRSVINATGILVHTNLGRATVSEATARAMAGAATNAVALEIEPETGRRGGRMDEISALLRLLAHAEAALVVNNNAAAILLTLMVLVSGKTVAVSRSEAVEIGGGFRIPDVLAQSGARMVEVGTTNRTYARDYQDAGISEGDAILKVHASNFAISGFTATPSLNELREVATEGGALLIEDLGSGTLIDTAQFGIDHEPTIQESLQAGADVVTFSGDKLLGGPQAGIIAGRKEVVDRIARHPLARAVRSDKTALAGIAETLRHYVRGDALVEIPLYRMMGASADDLQHRAQRLSGHLGDHAEVVTTSNHVGGGALPGQALRGIALRITPPGSSPDELARSLRLDEVTPVYGRIEDGEVLIELRTVLPDDDQALLSTLMRALSRAKSRPNTSETGQ